MNARGGPGIVVASTTFTAGIINQSFYATLVLLAVLTSLAAGAYLERIPRERLMARRGEPRTGRAGVAGSIPDFAASAGPNG
jgi:hypothetical protein